MRDSKGIVARYRRALKAFQEGHSMKYAFDSVGVDRCTIARTAPIAELKIAAPDVYKEVRPWDKRSEKLSAFVDRCRKAITDEIRDRINKLKTDDELLPFASK